MASSSNPSTPDAALPSDPMADAVAQATSILFQARPAPATRNEIVLQATRVFLDNAGQSDLSPSQVEAQLLATINALITKANQSIKKANERMSPLQALTAWQVAQIMLARHRIIRITPSFRDTDSEYDLLAMYVPEGRNRGIYTTSEDSMRTVARRYNIAMTLKDFGEATAILREDSPRLTQCTHPDLVAVNNGVVYYGKRPLDITINGTLLHFEPKEVHPFDPALVFLSKIGTDYVENPACPVITNPDGTTWDIHSWMANFHHTEGDDAFNERNAGMTDLLWEVISAMLRPNVDWSKTAWFYSQSGSNGKGTLCALMRNLVGPAAHTSIPLSDFGKDFALEPLVRATAIIVDENDVGTYIDKAANLKAVVTGDIIQINRKYRTPISFQFNGFMVQCLNEFPRVKDKSGSFYRRQLFVPFTKSFTGAERRYIKNDYLAREEVLEYVLWYAINEAGTTDPGNFYALAEPPATLEVLADYKESNEPERVFWVEHREDFVWDLLPFTFLYDAYKSWLPRFSPTAKPLSRQKFIDELMKIVEHDPDWYSHDRNRKIRPGQMMDAPEPLIAVYGLQDWYDPIYQGKDPLRLSCPRLAANYRGLLRATPVSQSHPAAGVATTVAGD